MSDARPGSLLGLFPDLAATGGVQASGRLAWAALQRRYPAERLLLFCRGAVPDELRRAGATVAADSRLAAVRQALGRRWPVDQVLIWHLGLLRLLPGFRLGRARRVLFLHGVEAWRRPDPLTGWLLRRVDLVLANSAHTWRQFVRLHPALAARPSRLVYLGLDAPLATPPPAPDPVPAALMLGRLARAEDYKGHRELIAAWPSVLAQQPEALLWIAGDGDLRPALERLVRQRGLADRIRFWGAVSEAQKQELLARARCLALPSSGEGFGLVYLEAMRLGRPCLVSTLDAGQEVVAPPLAGLAANPHDARALAQATLELLRLDDRWQQRSHAARERYAAQFTARHFEQRLLEALAFQPAGQRPAGAGWR